MVGGRRKARALAVQALYEIDSAEHDMAEVVARLPAMRGLSEDNILFVHKLVGGVIHNKVDIDQNIRNFATVWPIEQISLVDRNILRLAIFEILHDNKVPVKVAIDEAVELAKTFGSHSSSRFVNGVLGSVSALDRKI